ncbi:hypothetical protein [Xanthomonas translucens]|nr:hypothetical protein [Xanthomonas translucens]QSQ41092.1 hypothetical protein ISN33_16020 [Xanthomonas translucens pv. translucens]QSQ47712.1 hypothetical protein ISN35_11420 [Xanthomonas translucens pv. undulosa]UKE42535.1 hypothetical protein KAF26_13770 [Xanthomonas translucens pv. secalis]UPU48470.1 hypothetical protein MZO50_17445 [Xanthomonas translucens pv. undulosa]WLA02105.1 hypothetical protein MO330_06030 [Xanthomonas translucens]
MQVRIGSNALRACAFVRNRLTAAHGLAFATLQADVQMHVVLARTLQ